MNKSTSQPPPKEFEASNEWVGKQPENQQIQHFKVILKSLPHIQKHKWPNRFNRQGVQSLSNLECIVENSLEESNIMSSMDEIADLDYIDSVDSLTDEINFAELNRVEPLNRPIEFRYVPSMSNRIVVNNSNNLNKESISTIANLSNQLKSDALSKESERTFSVKHTNLSSNQMRSNLHEAHKRSNYQSNLNNFNNSLDRKPIYKQIKTDENDNFSFGPPNQELEEQKLRDTASRNRNIRKRQNFCDYLTLFLIFSAFISILVAIVLLLCIALDAWSMQLAFTVTLIALCILTILLVLFASFTANFVWFYNSNTNSINWMLHYGRKNYHASDYYFGKSLKATDEENNNEIESNLIQQV